MEHDLFGKPVSTFPDHALSAVEFGGAHLVRQLIEHGIDHAGFLVVDEGTGDVDIFRHYHAGRHVGAAGELVGAGAQHRAQHRLDALERPAAGQSRIDLRVELALLAHYPADDVAKISGLRPPTMSQKKAPPAGRYCAPSTSPPSQWFWNSAMISLSPVPARSI